jgi:hypothetical protein
MIVATEDASAEVEVEVEAEEGDEGKTAAEVEGL